MTFRICLLSVVLAICVSAAETRLLHQPSYHGGNVTFVFQNDLWIAAENGSGVRRLTATRAVESLPRFSPDGKWIAYTSNREGYQAVFVIPSSGGVSRQLSYFGGDRVVGWTPDSRKVLFASQRGVGFGGTLSLWDVPLEGGMERQIIADRSVFGSYSPDQKYLAYNRHGSQGYRKHYRGSSAADIWIMDTAAKTFRRLSDPEIQCDEAWPMYAKDGSIYFASDRMPDEKHVKPGSPKVMKSVSNLWKVPASGGKAVQVTQHATGGVFIPSMTGDGRTIVYEQDFGIWKLDTVTGETEIRIRIDSSEREAPVQTLTIDSDAETFDVSPSTKRAAIASHGLILTIATEAGEVQKVTDAVAHDRLPRWSPDAKTIAFLSDRSGRDEVWLSDERGSAPRQLSNVDGDKGALMWAPDSKSLFYTSENRLLRIRIADGKQELSVEEGIGIQSAQVSPDGKWLAYAISTPSDLVRTYIKPLAGGPAHNVSRKGFSRSYSPAWTPDGKKLLMLVSNAGAVDRPQSMLFAVNLQRENDNPNYKGIDTEADAAKAPAPAGPGAKAVVDVKIDWDDLDRRTRQVSRLSEHINSFAISPDGKTYALVAGGQVYAIDDEGGRQNRLSQSGAGAGAPVGLQFSKDGRNIYFREGNTIFAVATTPPPQAAGTAPKRKIAFTARFAVDFEARRKVVFNEAWRVIRNRYYNKALNGVDWEAVRKQYEPLLAFADDQEGMADVIRMMIGELNTSHTTAFVPLPQGTPRAGNAFPGFEVVPDSSGFYKISRVLKRGPADRDYSKIKVGDYLLAVNGASLKSGDNYWKAYRTSTGRAMQFTLNSQPKVEGSWQASLNPAVDPRSLYYDEWVSERRAKVEELSGGDFAYIHLRVMSPEIMQQFEEDLYEARFKKGLVIDVRFNGGGNLEMELLKIVQQKAYMNLVTRNGVVFPRPYRGFYGSMIVLQNENSGSNAEMFPLGFRQLGLGKLVGVRTPGQVLLGSDVELSDGTHMGIAHGTVQTLEGRNLENNGVKPDIHIDNLPDDAMKGRDAQLEKAIESLRQTVAAKGSK